MDKPKSTAQVFNPQSQTEAGMLKAINGKVGSKLLGIDDTGMEIVVITGTGDEHVLAKKLYGTDGKFIENSKEEIFTLKGKEWSVL